MEVKNYTDAQYITLERWTSYFFQFNETLKIFYDKNDNVKILEIGIGNKIVSNILESHLKGMTNSKIITIDINKNLKPDIIGDIRYIPFKNNSFDIILCFEVLEHINYKDLSDALFEIKRVTKRYILLSIPHNSIYFSFIVKIPRILLKTFLITSDLMSYSKIEKEHFWELGYKNYSYKKLSRKFKDLGLIIDQTFRNPFFPYHHFLKLIKKDEA